MIKYDHAMNWCGVENNGTMANVTNNVFPTVCRTCENAI